MLKANEIRKNIKTEESVKYLLLQALKLSPKEKAVLAVLEKQKMARNARKIGDDAGIPRTTAIYILEKLKGWRIAAKVGTATRTKWMYRRSLDFAGNKPRFLEKSNTILHCNGWGISKLLNHSENLTNICHMVT